MGIKKMFILDRDVVDMSNLNRQILYGKDDVGAKKVEAAQAELNRAHNISTEIVPLHMDAVIYWHVVVKHAKECSVIFNCIDHGSVFDFAVNSLCKKLQIPSAMGSSYHNTMEVEYYSGRPFETCWNCMRNTNESFFMNQNQEADLATWLKAKQVTKFNEALLIQFHEEVQRMGGANAVTAIQGALKSCGKTELTPKEYRADFLKHLQQEILQFLLPSNISEQKDISFIPKDAPFPTRTVGSWVCVCSGAALMIVNAWVQDNLVVNEEYQKAKESDPKAGTDFPSFSSFYLSNFTSFNSVQQGSTGKMDDECFVCNEKLFQK
eukprot:TRINITY_DN1547_c0_g1_i1.p1 TRINITY_DN1547_c0_g1~~TRINITY_DN1547_c0_g1_i1.p1  ORF type:complete len:349 (-),score=55.55 TRINITY_DN1547_c0_g1_i1:52-1017(-)